MYVEILQKEEEKERKLNNLKTIKENSGFIFPSKYYTLSHKYIISSILKNNITWNINECKYNLSHCKNILRRNTAKKKICWGTHATFSYSAL